MLKINVNYQRKLQSVIRSNQEDICVCIDNNVIINKEVIKIKFLFKQGLFDVLEVFFFGFFFF